MEKLTQEIDLGLAKILVLSNMINRKTDFCCFVNDTAHCRYIEVKLYKDIKSYNGIPTSFKVFYDETDNKNRLDDINRCIEFLEMTLKDKYIYHSALHAIKEYVITSYEI